MRRLLRNRSAVIGMVVMTAIVLICVIGPSLSPFDPDEPAYDSINLPPDLASGHLLGTDELGRDLLTRLMVGGRVSLGIALAATAVSMLLGVLYGAIAGFVGGRVDAVMMRGVDILYALPFLFFVIMLTTVFGRSTLTLLLAIGAVNWLTVAVIVRGMTLSLKRREFVEAAVAGGMTRWRVLTRHVIPNTLGTVVVYAGLTVPEVILGESFLSFLGLGVEPPAASWGTLLDAGAQQMEAAPWQLIFPGLLVAAALFSLNYIADGLRDAFDPKER